MKKFQILMKPYPHNTDYWIIPCGRVWSEKSKKFLSPGNHEGYPFVVLCHKGVTTTKNIHTLILETFVGDRPDGLQCRHLDGNKNNNHISNLCWGTPKENAEDFKRHLRQPGYSPTPLIEESLNGLTTWKTTPQATQRLERHMAHSY